MLFDILMYVFRRFLHATLQDSVLVVSFPPQKFSVPSCRCYSWKFIIIIISSVFMDHATLLPSKSSNVEYVHIKVKVSLCFNWAPRHEGLLGIGGVAPRILNLGTTWRWLISFTPRPLYPQGKSPWYPLDRRLGGPQSRSGRGGEEKNSQPPPGIET
jgi:hypothetical protein